MSSKLVAEKLEICDSPRQEISLVIQATYIFSVSVYYYHYLYCVYI